MTFVSTLKTGLKTGAFLVVACCIPNALYADNANKSQYESSYTSINEADCRLLEYIEEGESSVFLCPPFNDIKVQLLEGDLRQSINLIRNGKEYPLNLWSTGFSELGKLIEWRYKKKTPHEPVGLIVRLNISQGEDAQKNLSYLMVSKITSSKICLIGKIAPKPGENQNMKARDLLDSSQSKLCLDAPEMVLDGLVFRSKDKLEVGMRPNRKPAKRQWQLSFKGNYVQWQHADMVESGTFKMNDNGEIKAQFGSRHISAAYDGLELMNWDSVLYKLVKGGNR